MAPEVTRALRGAEERLPSSAYSKAVKLLSRYMRAVAESPAERRFRSIHADNPALQKRLGECTELLEACGWRLQPGCPTLGVPSAWTYADDSDGRAARHVLEALRQRKAPKAAAPRGTEQLRAARSCSTELRERTNVPRAQQPVAVKAEPRPAGGQENAAETTVAANAPADVEPSAEPAARAEAPGAEPAPTPEPETVIKVKPIDR